MGLRRKLRLVIPTRIRLCTGKELRDEFTLGLSHYKGGVLKTTSTLHLGVGLSRLGLRVLLVDLDMQQNLTAWILGVPRCATAEGEPRLSDAILSKEGLDHLITETSTKGVDLVAARGEQHPGCIALHQFGYRFWLVGDPGERRLSVAGVLHVRRVGRFPELGQERVELLLGVAHAFERVCAAQQEKGLEDRFKPGPGRPRTIPEDVRVEIAETKRRFPDFGMRKVRDWLLRFHGIQVSAGTVKKTLAERELEPPAPPKKKRQPPRRSERARPMQLWQSDITSYVLTRHSTRVYLVVFLDDRSRYVMSWSLCTHQKTDMPAGRHYALRQAGGGADRPGSADPRSGSLTSFCRARETCAVRRLAWPLRTVDRQRRGARFSRYREAVSFYRRKRDGGMGGACSETLGTRTHRPRSCRTTGGTTRGSRRPSTQLTQNPLRSTRTPVGAGQGRNGT